MPVDSRHPDYVKNVHIWKKCRDAVEGEDSVKAAGPAYLHRLDQQTDEDYAGYRDRALFFGATGRTLKGLVGTVNRKPPQVDFPEQFRKTLLNQLSPDGEPMELIAQQALEEVLSVGRMGMLVDAPSEGDGGNPYVAVYYAENIINWRTKMLPDGTGKMRMQPTLIVLLENTEVEDEDDAYELEMCERYRVLKLDTSNVESSAWLYTVEVWEKQESDEKEANGLTKEPVWVQLETYEPAFKGGKRPNFIPFKIINPAGTGTEVDKSPLLDLVNVNMSHYRSSADLEHGRHLVALPTVYLIGFDPKEGGVRIGSDKAWTTENVGAECGFLEFTGQGLGALEKALEEKEKMMAVLGGRLLEEEKKQAESAAAIRLRQAGEKSVLAVVSATCSEGITDVLRWVAMWAGVDATKVNFALNQDFNTSMLDGQTLTALMAALQGGAMSFDSWYNLLESAEMYPDDWTMEKEKSAIAAGPPELPPGIIDPAPNPAALPSKPNTPPIPVKKPAA